MNSLVVDLRSHKSITGELEDVTSIPSGDIAEEETSQGNQIFYSI